MARRLLIFLSLLVAGCAGGRALAQPDANALFKASREADDDWSYVGVKRLRRVRSGSDHVVQFRVSHRATPRATYVAVFRDGKTVFEVLEIGDDRYLRRPGQLWRKDDADASRHRTALLLNNYRPQSVGTRIIAKRSCLGVKLAPRYPGNPYQVVWIDKATRLVLKTQMFDHQGRLTVESEYETIDFHAKFTPRCFQPPLEARIQARPEVQPHFRLVEPAPKAIPPGYQRVQLSAWKSPEGQEFAITRYSNGLNTLSLIQSNAPLPPPRRRPGQPPKKAPPKPRGPKPILRTVGGIHCALFGDLDPKLLSRMAASLRASQ